MSAPLDDGQECPRAWEAMPWVLQGSATQEQSQWLRDHLTHCASCSAEFDQQSRLKQALSLPPDIALDADAGLTRLMARLDTPERSEISARARILSSPWVNRILVAAVLIQAIGLGTLGVKSWMTDRAPSYRTLSEAPTPAAAGSIRVVPDASMTLDSWNQLLHELQLQVVGGPNKVGAYMVAPTLSHASMQRTLKALRAQNGIRLAEPIITTP